MHGPIALLWLLLLPTLGCRPDGTRGGGTPQNGQSLAATSVDLERESAWPPSFEAHPLWRRASAGDDFDLARLADAESAAGLLSAVEHGGSLGRTALLALTYATDRFHARGRLCELLHGARGKTRDRLVAALHGCVTSGRRGEETASLRVDASCRDALRELESTRSLSDATRDLVRASLTSLARP